MSAWSGQVALTGRATLAVGGVAALADGMPLCSMEAGSGAVEFHQLLG
jgi:hypothetical protein